MGSLNVDDIEALHDSLLPFLVGDRGRSKKAIDSWARRIRKRSADKEKATYTAQEVADLFSVSLFTIRRWRDKGTLPFKKVNSRTYRYPKAQIDQLLEGKSKRRSK